MAIFRQDVIKQITDRPGDVVYRREIEEALGLTGGQVSAAVLNFQNNSPMGNEVETVMRGNAWRFVPNQPVTSDQPVDPINGQVHVSDQQLPLTTLIRQYLIDHPHQPVYVTDLASYTGAGEYQVKVGVNNMRRIQANGDIAPYVVTEIRGQCWRFDPPPDWRPHGVPSSVPPRRPGRPSSSVVAQTTSLVADSTTPVDAHDVRRFEEVGTAGDAIIIRDDDGNMFRAVPLT